MCLSCTYNSFAECKICKSDICRKEIYSGLCICCFRGLPKKSKCRDCNIIFDSRNKLFKHLKDNPAHKKDRIEIKVYYCGMRKYFNTWMEEYEHFGYFY